MFQKIPTKKQRRPCSTRRPWKAEVVARGAPSPAQEEVERGKSGNPGHQYQHAQRVDNGAADDLHEAARD